MTDFFISYTGADKAWAEWIASILKAAGFSFIIQAWDFRPGGNFVVEMHRAAAGSDRTLAVLSPDYLRSLYGMAEWAAAFAADPDGAKRKLVPVKVREVALEGLLTAIIHINLVGLGEAAAREALLSGLAHGRIRPESVRFPGAHLFPGPAPSTPDPDKANAVLEALPLEEVPQPGPLPLGSRMPLAPNPLFVGREEDLRTLARQLKAGETSAVGQVTIAAATGLGGITTTPEDILTATKHWLEKAIIGLNLCPFAKAVYVRDQIRYVVSEAETPEALLADLIAELQGLAEADLGAIDTTLIIHPRVLGDFLDYNDFLGVADAAVVDLGLEGVIQVASFHPEYQFAGSGPDDIENYTNRSPYPILHLLREASVERAVAAFPEASEIYEKNMATMRRLGIEGWRRLGLRR